MTYREIVEEFGFKVLYWKDFGITQGNSLVILKSKSEYGYLVIGWGDSIGTDMLLSCISDKDYEDLRNKLIDKIYWNDAAKIIKHLADDSIDWYLYGTNDDDFEEVFKEATKIIINDLKNDI